MYRFKKLKKYGESAFPEKRSALFGIHDEIKKLEQGSRYLSEELDL